MGCGQELLRSSKKKPKFEPVTYREIVLWLGLRDPEVRRKRRSEAFQKALSERRVERILQAIAKLTDEERAKLEVAPCKGRVMIGGSNFDLEL